MWKLQALVLLYLKHTDPPHTHTHVHIECTSDPLAARMNTQCTHEPTVSHTLRRRCTGGEREP